MGIENPVHILFVAVIALIVLGPRRLPQLAKSLGRGVREFREAISGESQQLAPPEPFGAAPPAEPPAPAASPAPPPPAG